MLVSLVTALASTGALAYAEPDPVQVFSSREPESFDDFSAVFAVTRDVPAGALMEEAVAALIAGPTLAERTAGYFSAFRTLSLRPEWPGSVPGAVSGASVGWESRVLNAGPEVVYEQGL